MKTFNEFILESKLLNTKTLSPETLAKKHGVSVATIMKQLDMGMKVEREHTKQSRVAREIALDHIGEMPDYYTKLKKMEDGK